MSLSVPLAPGWQTYTMYDVLPGDCRASISNTDTADVFGDLYFAAKDRWACSAAADTVFTAHSAPAHAPAPALAGTCRSLAWSASGTR
jgi:hypothetical protein